MVETSAEGGFQGTNNIDCLTMPVMWLAWNQKACAYLIWVERPHNSGHKEESLFKGIHEYLLLLCAQFAVPEYEHTLTSCTYGNTFSAAINKDNFTGAISPRAFWRGRSTITD